MYTKEYLQTLYDKEKETIKKNRISKQVKHIKHKLFYLPYL